MSTRPGRIAKVNEGSIAEEVGIVTGDVLLQIDGKPVEDIFDYRFCCASEELEVTIEKLDGEIWEIEIEKDFDDDLGIEFENPMISEEKSCSNNCVFCFIDQLPKGMRETLYFKDDDSRLSFLTGNYVTLTNMKDEDLDRIINYRLSPINISVHATDSKLREKMLGNRFAGKILAQIKRITDARIVVNAQIVVCPGYNDGAELEKTILELSEFFPGVNSVSVVPVGLTRYREGLVEIKPFDETSAGEVIEQVNRFQSENIQKYGSRIIFAADEFYVKAKVEVPDYSDYEDFPQIENGVGLIASLKRETEDICKMLAELPKQKVERKVLIATGMAAENFIKELTKKVQVTFEGLVVSVIGVRNIFFGENVTVCGLLTGRDVCEAVIQAKLKGETAQTLIICGSMLKAGEEVFLDDFTIEELESETGMEVLISDNSGKQFVECISGMEIEIGYE